MAMQIVERLVHRVAKLLRQHGGVGRVRDSGLHDREFVAAEPREDVALAAGRLACAPSLP